MGFFIIEHRKLISTTHPNIAFQLPDSVYQNDLTGLHGFDNTGNCRLWPGGEALAAYFLHNPEMLYNKSVIELGAGAFGLPSLIASKYAKNVYITDGNKFSVDNLNLILKTNNLLENAHSGALTWQKSCDPHSINSLIDCTFGVVIACDCIFFEENHHALLDTLDAVMAPDGYSLFCAPNRKGSLEKFLNFVTEDGRYAATVDENFEKLLQQKLVQVTVDHDEIPKLYCLCRKPTSKLR